VGAEVELAALGAGAEVELAARGGGAEVELAALGGGAEVELAALGAGTGAKDDALSGPYRVWTRRSAVRRRITRRTHLEQLHWPCRFCRWSFV
jgi:hypothetical protein